ncbi:MAG: hypothetical protein KME08_09025 [Aphanothece sp. CMT-3BRIN-NPC111]|nr:hypothetical protein [Aphanothece sp. CMT-3BRIN-NPC111]
MAKRKFVVIFLYTLIFLVVTAQAVLAQTTQKPTTSQVIVEIIFCAISMLVLNHFGIP